MTGNTATKHTLPGFVCLLFVLSLACWTFFAQLGEFPLFNPDEALYAEPAREMLETGEYITTTLNYIVRYTKPPLCIWAMALTYKIIGVSEFSARFFGALSGVILILASYLFLEKFTNRRCAILCSLMLATAPLFVVIGRQAITDMPLALFMAGALMSFYHAFHAQKTFGVWIGYVLLGLAVMTKGPVGTILPAIILIVFHFLRKDIKEATLFYKPLWGAFVIAVIALPWFAVETFITQGAYFNEFLVRENFQRFTSIVDSHKGSWWYHLLAIIVGFFPWSTLLPQAITSAINLKTAAIKATAKTITNFRVPTYNSAVTNLNTFLAQFQSLPEPQRLMLFATCWSLVTLIFFSVSVSKLITYMVPAFPALAILVALEINEAVDKKHLLRLIIPFLVLATIYGASLSIAPLILDKIHNVPESLVEVSQHYAAFQLILCMASIVFMIFKKPMLAIGLFAGLTFCLSSYFGYQTLAALSKKWEAPIPTFCRFAANYPSPIIVFDLRKPSISFYAGKQVFRPKTAPQLQAALKACPEAYIITASKNQAYFKHLKGCSLLRKEDMFLLIHWQSPLPSAAETEHTALQTMLETN